MAVVNTGIVLRTITGVHDANFVHPIGDEEVVNGDFSDGSTDWILGTGWGVSDGKAVANTTGNTNGLWQPNTLVSGKTYKATYEVIDYLSGDVRINIGGLGGSVGNLRSANGTYTEYITSDGVNLYIQGRNSFIGSIDNISVKEVLVNRESTATNTGIVERPITGVNESDLWLDSESTSVVNNTGIVERPITGVNESDPMFPDNTISNIVNIAGLISSLIADLKARATTFENEDATRNILINLQNC